VTQKTIFDHEEYDQSWGPTYDQLPATVPASSPAARNTDPITSHLGAAHVTAKLTETQQQFLEAARQFNSPATAYEIAEVAHASHPETSVETFRKRAHELVNLGRLATIARRKCNRTGNPARTFKVKP
jgi:hypothetical protein